MSLPLVRARVERWLNDRPDDAVLRWLFRTMLAATAAVLVLDYTQFGADMAEPISVVAEPGGDITKSIPQALPSVRRAGHDRRSAPLGADPQLARPMTFDLLADGRLLATGTIEPGTAKTFAAEVEKRGSYVKTVVLHSPGGSVADALLMGRLVRQKQFGTEVPDGRYCASSCPLIFAGGVERTVGEKSAIGVHQVAAVGGDSMTAARGMESVQRVSAECQKYLLEMGIDPLVWIHAMETPKEELFYFQPDELVALKLATGRAGVVPAEAANAPVRKKS